MVDAQRALEVDASPERAATPTADQRTERQIHVELVVEHQPSRTWSPFADSRARRAGMIGHRDTLTAGIPGVAALPSG